MWQEKTMNQTVFQNRRWRGLPRTSLAVIVWAMATLAIVGCKQSGTANVSSSSEQNGATGADQESQDSQDSSIGGWATDTWNGAVNGGSQTVEQTRKWISEMYQSAKDQGITSANSMKDWVADDWNAQGDWQYKIMSLDPGDTEAVESKLNAAGTDRWECYHVDTGGPEWTFFMKRSRRSYLSRVPLKDLVNLMPGGDDGGQ